MSSDFAIIGEDLSKCYRIYQRPQDRLKEAILPRLQKLIGIPESHYGQNFWALQNISFSIARGETVGIVGKNGSGKSTLLQIICGTLTPSSGRIETYGRIAALLELGAGFNPEFTGRENVYMNGALYGLSRAQVDARFDNIAAFADIGRFLEQPVKTYSSGMFVRLAFAVIAHLDADILVIDEALAVGDAYFTQKCMRYLRRFMESGTVLFVSHDMASVKALAGRSIWLENGRLQSTGDTRKIADAYLRALYAQGQDVDRSPHNTSPDSVVTASQETCIPVEDFRIELLAESGLQNRLAVFQFDPKADGFGDGRATIIGATLLNSHGETLRGVNGGEMVNLEIRVESHDELVSPIVGFFLRNRLGQNVFGDNSALIHRDTPLVSPANTILLGCFQFVMPFLPRGDYSVSVAVASGSNHEHVQHHWLHDAFMLKSLSSDVHADLFGVPMSNISLEMQDPPQPLVRI